MVSRQDCIRGVIVPIQEVETILVRRYRLGGVIEQGEVSELLKATVSANTTIVDGKTCIIYKLEFSSSKQGPCEMDTVHQK